METKDKKEQLQTKELEATKETQITKAANEKANLKPDDKQAEINPETMKKELDRLNAENDLLTLQKQLQDAHNKNKELKALETTEQPPAIDPITNDDNEKEYEFTVRQLRNKEVKEK